MGLKCPRSGCAGNVSVATYDGPVRCEYGHTLRFVEDRAWRFLQRATNGVNA